MEYKLKPNEKLILSYISKCNNEYITIVELQELTKINGTHITQYLKDLEDKKLIIRIKEGKKWKILV